MQGRDVTVACALRRNTVFGLSLHCSDQYFSYNEENISTYFSLGVCMEGLNMLFQSLFDVTLENITPETGEVWHYDVYKLVSLFIISDK